MTYKTIVTDYALKAKKMADEIEKVINEKAKDGWEPVTFSVTNSCKAIKAMCLSFYSSVSASPKSRVGVVFVMVRSSSILTL